MAAREYNFDGIVGPTHNYAGLSFGNVASEKHKSSVSQPRAAALQGLSKMRFVRNLGIGQAVLPPLLRPNLRLLHEFGFRGKTDVELIQNAHKKLPNLVAACFSASNMWTANAATVSPSVDCEDGKVHFTPANLASKLHRSIEANETRDNLRRIFPDPDRFVVHDPLPSAMAMTDEGAANFMRLCANHGEAGIEAFVWGRSDFGRYASDDFQGPKKFPARQTLESCESIALRHGLRSSHTLHLQQHPDAIDAGVFHNDVISVANENVILAHELAFAQRESTIELLSKIFEAQVRSRLYYIEFSLKEINLADTVASYLFNSQLLTRPDNGMTLLCPEDVRQSPSAYRCTQRLLEEENPVNAVEFLDLRQSMNNGGGPACLRLRVALNEKELESMHQGVLFTEELESRLKHHIELHYRKELAPSDLLDPKLIEESYTAHDNLMRLLNLRA